MQLIGLSSQPIHVTGLLLYPLKYQKTIGSRMFSGGIDRDQWQKMGKKASCGRLLQLHQ